MKNTKLQFSNNLPAHEVILQNVQHKFPAAKAKLSFNGFIDVTINDVAASLDLTATEIIISTNADTTRPKFILLFMLAFIPYMYCLFEFTNIGLEHWHLGVALAVFLAIGRGLIYLKTKPAVELVHDDLVLFLKDHYRGAAI